MSLIAGSCLTSCLTSTAQASSALPEALLGDRSTQSGADGEDDVAAPVVQLTEAELNAPVSLTLSESETVTLFSLSSLRVLQDTEEFARVTARNEKYAQLVQVRVGGGRVCADVCIGVAVGVYCRVALAMTAICRV